MSSVERLDFSKPPSGHDVWHDDGDRREDGEAFAHDCVGWHAGADDGNGDHDLLNDAPFDTEAGALAAAWTHHEARHDPPGMKAAEARAAAWAWYERRSNLVARLDRMAQENKFISAVGVFEPGALWPDALAWSDHYAQQVEGVLRG